MYRKIIFFIMIIFISLFNINLSYATNENKFNILVINSYDEDDEWENNILNGFKNEINKLLPNQVKIFSEYIDVRYRQDSEYIFEFIDSLENKYKSRSIDFVFTIDDAAFEIAKYKLLDKDSIFYLKNIIFTGVNKTKIIEEEKSNYISGVLQDTSAKLIDTILNMQHNIDTINVLINNFNYSNQVKNDMLAFESVYKRPVKINFIQKYTIEEVKNELIKIKDNDEVIIVCDIFKDEKSNEYISPSETIKQIKSITDMPIYTTNEIYVDEGIVGGYVTKSEQQGMYAAKELYNKINKNNYSNNFATSDGKYIFDYNMIYKYDIDVYNIPKQSCIINKPFNAPILSKRILLCLYISLFSLSGLVIYFIKFSILNKKIKKDKKLQERIENERNKMRANFIVNMSHELRTPVNLMLLTSDVAIKKIENDNFTKESLIQEFEQIQKNSNRLLKIVNNVIDMTKLQYGDFDLKLQNLNIVDVVENIIIEVLEYLDYSVDINFDSSIDELIIAIDEEQIQRVILNLISNSIKFAPKSKIDIKIQEQDNNVCISITDYGKGISEKQMKKVFNPFYYVGNTLVKTEEGSGVGLYISKRIIHLHGGTIRASSNNFKTTFKIRLPKEIVEEDKKIVKIYDFRNAIKVEMADINTKEI